MKLNSNHKKTDYVEINTILASIIITTKQKIGKK